MTEYAIKRVAPDTVEGLAIPFATKDVAGESFTPSTDYCLEWFGKSGRPLLYEHGFDPAHKRTPIGRQLDFEVREEGIWAQSQLDANAKYRKAIDKLIDEGALGYSSGSVERFAQKTAAGVMTVWPWIELSLTPTPAAGQATNVNYTIKSAQIPEMLDHLEEVGSSVSMAAVKAIAAALGGETSPDTDSLDDQAGRVSAAVEMFRDHARASAEMRVKSGRVLSSANRDRIAKALASKDAVLGAYADLEALLSETDPESAAKSALMLEAALAEVALNRYALK